MFEIVEVYKTSKGYFHSLEEASKKKNRIREFDRGGFLYTLEPIKKVVCLKINLEYYCLDTLKVEVL